LPTIEDSHGSEVRERGPADFYEQQQRRRMLIALGVLVLALILVLVKDRQFWLPSTAGTDSETSEPTSASPEASAPAPVLPPAAAAVPEKTAPPPGVPLKATRSHNAAVRSAPAKPTPEPAMSPVITATNRAVLPPLEVEVVAGNQHHPIQSANNPLHLDLQPGAAAAPDMAQQKSQDRALATEPNATASVQLSPGTAQILSRPVNPNYPLLAKQMKVQGAVVLQALISKTGTIQDIQVLSGPAILSAAAREAVQQWRFKPYYQSGQPVETEARITVNFTISTY